MNAPKTATLLVKLLEKQHQTRSPELLKKGTFILRWRAKVGSFPYPNQDTIISAGEPCGRWDWLSQDFDQNGNPLDFGELGDRRLDLPLNGYIPGSAIRGIIRAWVKKRQHLLPQLRDLLGNQTEDEITAGKIEFLDAYPRKAQRLSLDIVNPQTDFQVYHQPQGSTPQACNPQPLYTLGNGKEPVEFTIAIRGIPGKANPQDVETAWEWVQQALSAYGIGGRTASGYGRIEVENPSVSRANLQTLDPQYSRKSLEFVLYSQGCYGVNNEDRTVRPAHWRGWLRSWALRFLLGVMSKADAELALADLFGAIEPKTYKGCVRLQMNPGNTWGERSKFPYFYVWKGQLYISAPADVLEPIIFPIIRFAMTLGGVGRGWRRPLHIYYMDNGTAAARGCLLRLAERQSNPETKKPEFQPCDLSLDTVHWAELYEAWLEAVRERWGTRFEIAEGMNRDLEAEVFSRHTCAVYAVPGPVEEPIDRREVDWKMDEITKSVAEETRGAGMSLIYQPRYKRKPQLGGRAGNGAASCSWASIRRVNKRHPTENATCQEIVCLFTGGQPIDSNGLRSQFLRDLHDLSGATRLFGVQPPEIQ